MLAKSFNQIDSTAGGKVYSMCDSRSWLDSLDEEVHWLSVFKILSRDCLVLLLLTAVGMLVWLVLRSGGSRGGETAVLGTNPPLTMPLDGEVDHRFDFSWAMKSAEIPLALRFDSAMGDLVYNAQKFWDMNEKRGGHHTGDDLNGIGGMNSDLGDPVFSVADGLVIYAGEPSTGWGNTVVIAHRVQDGRVLHSMYAHLDRIDVRPGALVARGQMIGTVGTGNDYYPAHLHFEMRDSDHVDMNGGYMQVKLNRLDPVGTLRELRNAPTDDEAPSPLAVMLKGL